MKYAIRSQFIAPKGKVLLAYDLSQAETWVVAHLAKEEKMKHALQFGDIHRLTSSQIFNLSEDVINKEQRYVGKKSNHAFSYKQGYISYTMNFNKESRELGFSLTLAEGKRHHIVWHNFYNVQTWWGEVEYNVKTTRQIRTEYGRIRTFYDKFSDELLKQATAHEPQSTVADHALGAIHPELGIKGGLLEIYKQYHGKNDIYIINTAHDSILLEVPVNVLDDVMVPIYNLFHRPLVVRGEQFTIPVDGEIGERWGELEKIPKEKLAA